MQQLVAFCLLTKRSNEGIHNYKVFTQLLIYIQSQEHSRAGAYNVCSETEKTPKEDKFFFSVLQRVDAVNEEVDPEKKTCLKLDKCRVAVGG